MLSMTGTHTDTYLLQAQALAESFACEASYWQRIYEMEAATEAYFHELVSELPEASTPYGKGFTAPVVMS